MGINHCCHAPWLLYLILRLNWRRFFHARKSEIKLYSKAPWLPDGTVKPRPRRSWCRLDPKAAGLPEPTAMLNNGQSINNCRLRLNSAGRWRKVICDNRLYGAGRPASVRRSLDSGHPHGSALIIHRSQGARLNEPGNHRWRFSSFSAAEPWQFAEKFSVVM